MLMSSPSLASCSRSNRTYPNTKAKAYQDWGSNGDTLFFSGGYQTVCLHCIGLDIYPPFSAARARPMMTLSSLLPPPCAISLFIRCCFSWTRPVKVLLLYYAFPSLTWHPHLSPSLIPHVILAVHALVFILSKKNWIKWTNLLFGWLLTFHIPLGLD